MYIISAHRGARLGKTRAEQRRSLEAEYPLKMNAFFMTKIIYIT
jgi:hypothetical protein